MITTGLHVPKVVLKRLAKAVAAFQRDTNNMTIAEWRDAYRERSGPTLGCLVSVDFTKTGAVKGFHARQIKGSTEKFRMHGFEFDVPLLGRAEWGAEQLQRACAEYFLRREIHQRREAGQRELIALSNDQLSDAKLELAPLKNARFYGDTCSGSLSEELRMALIDDEIKIRETESHHERLSAIEKNTSFIASCQQRLHVEFLAASAWRQKRQQSPYFHFGVGLEFRHRSTNDQTVIAYRNVLGW